MKPSSPERLEHLLGRVLKWGALTSTTLLAAGLALELAGVDAALASRLTSLGLIVLMATPVARVVVSVADYAAERDWLFLGLTATVLVILLGSLLVGSGLALRQNARPGPTRRTGSRGVSTTMAEHPFYLAGQWERSSTPLAVTSPFDNAVVGRTWLAGDDEFEAATQAAVNAAATMRHLPAFERSAILRRASETIKTRREEIARTIAGEVGKALKDALVEADRGASTFEAAAEEARRIEGVVIPMDLAPHGKGRVAFTRRFPIGPVAAISPFNFPFNLTAHKLAPAIAAGNPVVLKPATKTPLSALLLAEVLGAAGLPKGALSVLPMSRQTGDRLVTDDRFKLLTFTGSSPVGWGMKARAGRKKVVLELGGNAGVIVDETADLDFAVARIVAGGFALAGQSCISVQRVYVHATVFDRFAARLVAALEALKVGDPLDPATDVGPMIEEAEAARVDDWVQEAVRDGARVLTGGRRLGGALYAPTALADVSETSKVCTQEVFAPLVGLYRFDDFNDAMARVNGSSYGLQAGVFTNDLLRALVAHEVIEVGGVIVNDVSAWRIDHMPYGGEKDSGIGREGPRYAIEEMTEPRLLVINMESGHRV